MGYWQVLTFWAQEKNVHTQTKVHPWMGLNGEFKLACLLISTMCEVLWILSLLIVWCYFFSRFRNVHPPQELSEAVVQDLQQALAKEDDQASENPSVLQQLNCCTRWCTVCAHSNSVGENGLWTSLGKYGGMDQDQVSGSIDSPLIIRAQPSSPLDVEVRVATKRWIQWFHEIWYWLGLMGVKKVDA